MEFHLFINTSPCGDARIFSLHEANGKNPSKEASNAKNDEEDSGVAGCCCRSMLPLGGVIVVVVVVVSILVVVVDIMRIPGMEEGGKQPQGVKQPSLWSS